MRSNLIWNSTLLIFFEPINMATPEGRARERQRRVLLSAIASALAKLISVSTALISVPLTLNYLGAERYGMWMTMSSLIAMLSFADLGIGNGLLSSVATAHGEDDRTRIGGYVSSGYCVLLAIAFCVLGLFVLIYPYVDWYRIFNVKTEIARREAAPAVAVLVTCFALAIPIMLVQRVQIGMQRGFMASLWQCASSVVALAGVLIAIHLQAPLPALVLAFLGAPLLIGVLNSSIFFLLLQPDIAPTRHKISRDAIKTIAKTGLLFLVLQVVAALTYTSDNIILAQMLGAAAVTQYAVPEKLFSLISTVIAMVLTPLWPAYGEAIARGDRDWVRKTLKRSLLVSIGVASFCSAVLVITAPWIIHLWVRRMMAPSLLLLAGLGVWKVLDVGGNALSVFLNGARIVKIQVIISITTCIAAVSSKVFLVQHIGIPGVVWATVFSFLFLTAIPYYVLIKRDFAKRGQAL